MMRVIVTMITTMVVQTIIGVVKVSDGRCVHAACVQQLVIIVIMRVFIMVIIKVIIMVIIRMIIMVILMVILMVIFRVIIRVVKVLGGASMPLVCSNW